MQRYRQLSEMMLIAHKLWGTPRCDRRTGVILGTKMGTEIIVKGVLNKEKNIIEPMGRVKLIPFTEDAKRFVENIFLSLFSFFC